MIDFRASFSPNTFYFFQKPCFSNKLGPSTMKCSIRTPFLVLHRRQSFTKKKKKNNNNTFLCVFFFRRSPTPSRTSRRRREFCTYDNTVPPNIMILFIDNKKIVLSVFLCTPTEFFTLIFVPYVSLFLVLHGHRSIQFTTRFKNYIETNRFIKFRS